MAMRTRDEVFPNSAGIDVGASSHWVAVPSHSADQPVRQVGVMTTDLHKLADWLIECGVDTVALESTGVFWIPVYDVLEQRGLKVALVGTHQMRNVPGRKSDVLDCQWLQKLMSFGLLRAAFRPSSEVCVMRAISRLREVLLTDQASWVQRIQKALVEMNIQLTEVLSDVMGTTGQAIIRAIVKGERDPHALAKHRNSHVKASREAIAAALTGNWREEHLFVLTHALGMYDELAARLQECDTKLQALLDARSSHNVDLGKKPRAGTKAFAEYEVRQKLANWAGVDLTRIPGIGVTTVMTLLSEIGPDLSRFQTVKQFCAWLGLAPGTKISGGKVLSGRTKFSANRVRQALKMAAQALSHSHSGLGAFYKRLCARMDAPRANTAVAHKLARLVYFTLTRGSEFVDQGQARYEEQQRERSVAALRRRASALGFTIQATAA